MHPPSPTPAVHLTLSPTRTRAGAEASPTAALKAAMDTPQSRARPPQLPSRPNPPPSSSSSPPPVPRPSISSSANTSPSHDDFFFSFPSAASPFGGHHLLPLPLPMSRTPVGRVGSDLSHLNHAHARASRHHATTSTTGGITSSQQDRDRATNKASSPFFSSLAGAWRKETTSSSSRSDVMAGKQRPAEEKRTKQDRARQRALDVRQWVKRHMAAMVEQLRASFSRHHQPSWERERRRPHSFSGRGPGAVGEMRERERWRRRRRDQLSSAPASLRVSPAHSGHLSVGGSVKVSTSSEESTMEELQSAIEAAIAHCKNSISVAKQTAAAAAAAGDDDASKLQ